MTEVKEDNGKLRQMAGDVRKTPQLEIKQQPRHLNELEKKISPFSVRLRGVESLSKHDDHSKIVLTIKLWDQHGKKDIKNSLVAGTTATTGELLKGSDGELSLYFTLSKLHVQTEGTHRYAALQKLLCVLHAVDHHSEKVPIVCCGLAQSGYWLI